MHCVTIALCINLRLCHHRVCARETLLHHHNVTLQPVLHYCSLMPCAPLVSCVVPLCRSDPTENDSIEGLRPNARGPGLVTFGVSEVPAGKQGDQVWESFPEAAAEPSRARRAWPSYVVMVYTVLPCHVAVMCTVSSHCVASTYTMLLFRGLCVGRILSHYVWCHCVT